ncbi:MAG: TetR/AcrR family transcriptional regulator [Firmicutes bacterium]|nr:TetR/AcrR family transcriptional regulator [Bacillota bacterium]
MTENIDVTNTREIILERSKELFLALGYHKTTMRAIAEAAGISTGPLYFHFQSKAEVFFHICNQAFDYLIADFRVVAGDSSHAARRLKNIYYVYKKFYYREPQLFEIMHLATDPMAGIDLPAELVELLKQKAQEKVSIMEQVTSEGILRKELRPVEPRKLALYLYSVAEGIFLSNRIGVLKQSEISLDEMIEAAIDLVGLGMISCSENVRGVRE